MFRIVISDPEEGEAWQVEKDATPLIGTQVGEEFNGSLIGLDGYTLKVTGGSDREGFPMRKGVQGRGRREILMRGGPGYNPKENGVKARKSVRGGQISEEIVQVNTKVVDREKNAEPLPDLLGLEEEPSESEEKSEEDAEPEEEESEEDQKETKNGEEQTGE